MKRENVICLIVCIVLTIVRAGNAQSQPAHPDPPATAHHAPAGAEAPKPSPTIESLIVVIESLKAQLAQAQTSSALELRMCYGAVQAAREFVIGPPKQPTRPATP